MSSRTTPNAAQGSSSTRRRISDESAGAVDLALSDDENLPRTAGKRGRAEDDEEEDDNFVDDDDEVSKKKKKSTKGSGRLKANGTLTIAAQREDADKAIKTAEEAVKKATAALKAEQKKGAAGRVKIAALDEAEAKAHLAWAKEERAKLEPGGKKSSKAPAAKKQQKSKEVSAAALVQVLTRAGGPPRQGQGQGQGRRDRVADQ
jgi:hypothetical protein